jgi:hypothetical protein
MSSYLEIGLRVVEARKQQTSAERRVSPGPETSPIPRTISNNGAACSSPWCAGCYEVLPGVRIHPPKSGSHQGESQERGRISKV